MVYFRRSGEGFKIYVTVILGILYVYIQRIKYILRYFALLDNQITRQVAQFKFRYLLVWSEATLEIDATH